MGATWQVTRVEAEDPRPVASWTGSAEHGARWSDPVPTVEKVSAVVAVAIWAASGAAIWTLYGPFVAVVLFVWVIPAAILSLVFLTDGRIDPTSSPPAGPAATRPVPSADAYGGSSSSRTVCDDTP